jgi:hypothetical protein
MRPDGIGLKYHAHLTFVWPHEQTLSRRGQWNAFYEYFSLLGFFKSGNEPERRCLATARWAEQRKYLAFLDGETHLIHRPHRAKPLTHFTKF